MVNNNTFVVLTCICGARKLYTKRRADRGLLRPKHDQGWLTFQTRHRFDGDWSRIQPVSYLPKACGTKRWGTWFNAFLAIGEASLQRGWACSERAASQSGFMPAKQPAKIPWSVPHWKSQQSSRAVETSENVWLMHFFEQLEWEQRDVVTEKFLAQQCDRKWFFRMHPVFLQLSRIAKPRNPVTTLSVSNDSIQNTKMYCFVNLQTSGASGKGCSKLLTWNRDAGDAGNQRDYIHW